MAGLVRCTRLQIPIAVLFGFLIGSWRLKWQLGLPFVRTATPTSEHNVLGAPVDRSVSTAGGNDSASDVDRNLAYWDSAVATANEIRAMVKIDLEREYGLSHQGELLSRLVKAVREMQGKRQHEWASRLRTTAAPTPHRRPTCVNNPPMHYERTGDMIKECRTFKRTTDEESPGWRPTRAAIITLKPPTDPEVRARVSFLAKQGISAVAFAATDGAKTFANEYSKSINPDTGRPETLFTDSRVPNAKPLRRGDPAFLTPGERGYVVYLFAFGCDRKRPSLAVHAQSLIL